MNIFLPRRKKTKKREAAALLLSAALPALGESAEAWSPLYTVEPTCTEQGYTAYENFFMPGTVEYRDFVPALGHTWGPWEDEYTFCKYYGTRTHQCRVCGAEETEMIPPTGHDWGPWSTYTEPDCENAGLEHRFCNNCGQPEEKLIPPWATPGTTGK